LVNLCFSLFPFLGKRHNIDRKGRLHGNFLAICDVIQGKINPANLVQIKQNFDK
jgi:hypothetical protein